MGSEEIEIRKLIENVGDLMYMDNQWKRKMEEKLNKINITSVSKFMCNVHYIDSKLSSKREKMLWPSTLRLLYVQGYEEILRMNQINKDSDKKKVYYEREHSIFENESGEEGKRKDVHEEDENEEKDGKPKAKIIHSKGEEAKKQKVNERAYTLIDDESLSETLKCITIPKEIYLKGKNKKDSIMHTLFEEKWPTIHYNKDPIYYNTWHQDKTMEVCYQNLDQEGVQPYHIWVGDTGASCHMTNQKEGFYMIWNQEGKANFAHQGKEAIITNMGNWKGRQFHAPKEGKQLLRGELLDLKNVMYVPDLRHNLYSLTQGISDGGVLSNEDDVLILTFENYKLKFDHKIKAKNGYVMGAIVDPIGIAKDDTDNTNKMDINEFHQLTHHGENILKASALRLNIVLTGTFKVCVSCAKANAKKKMLKIKQSVKEKNDDYPGQ
jgi:hypothetical protein